MFKRQIAFPFLLLSLLLSLLSLSYPQTVKVYVSQKEQKIQELGDDYVIYQTKYIFQNSSSEPFSLIERNFEFLIPSGKVIDKGDEPINTEGTIPPKGEFEWTDYPYIAKRWADEALKKGSDRLILRQYFRIKGEGKISEIYCDTTYLLDPSQISNLSLPKQIKLVRGTKKPLPLDGRAENGMPVLPWVKLNCSIENPQIARIDGNSLIGEKIGKTTLHIGSSKIKVSTEVEVIPALGDEKIIPPLLRLLPGEKRFIYLDNIPPDEITGFAIDDKNIASRGEPSPPQTQQWTPQKAMEIDIGDAEEIIQGKNPGRTRIIVRGLKQGTRREGEIEVVEMKKEPVNHWRLAMFIFPQIDVELNSVREKLSYKPEEIEGIKEAGRRLSEVVKYFTAGALSMDIYVGLVEKEKITKELIEDTKVYGYRLNLYKAEQLLRKVSFELWGRPLSFFDDIVVCSPMPKAGAAWGGWEFNIDGIIVRGLYIPNYWKEGTPIWGDMVEVLLHEWIHCLEGHIVRNGLKPIPSADGGAEEGEILTSIKDPTFRRPRKVKTWMPYYLHILRDFLSPDDWGKLQTSYKREGKQRR